MKVCIIGICYNAYPDCLKFLQSISNAYNETNNLDLSVVVCDNSSQSSGKEVIENYFANFGYTYLKLDNIGYFPAFTAGLRELHTTNESYDLIIVSNVDLTLDHSFFTQLLNLKISSDVGVIAPSILSLQTRGDINPKIMTRPSKFKLKALRYGFSFLPFYRLYNWASVKKAEFKALVGPNLRHADLASSRYPSGTIMYGAHGSIMLFTKNYLKNGASLNYPRFLFGEEVFVAEEARRKKLLTIYEPSLKVYDGEHVSTSRESDRFISGEHVKSYIYLLNKFF